MRRYISAGVAGVALLLALGACAADSGQDDQESLTVFAAASLQEAFDDLLEQFAAAHPDVEVAPGVYEGSSTLVTQLQEGATADVLATANEPTMEDALAAGVTVSAPKLFASNDLVIAVPEANPHRVEGFDDVLQLDYAICAVQVPCGEATAQLFEAAGVSPDPVSEERNVTSVANRVSAGDVDAGFVYSTDVVARPELTGIPPQVAQIVNHYPIATTSEASAGRQFVEFVLSEQGSATLASYGFGQP